MPTNAPTNATPASTNATPANAHYASWCATVRANPLAHETLQDLKSAPAHGWTTKQIQDGTLLYLQHAGRVTQRRRKREIHAVWVVSS